MRLASLDCLAENVGVQSIVISELEFYDIERQVFVTDLVEIAHNTALDQRPEALDCVRMNRADDMLTNVVVNGLYAGTDTSIGYSCDRRLCKAGSRGSRRFRGRNVPMLGRQCY